jgi:hypothetical protein
LPIQYVPYKQIDFTKWDNCIIAASNGLIYCQSFYLNAMCQFWDALVLNDYELVMPLTYNKKYGFYYLYQPHFTASLGVFGKYVSAEILHQFLTAIPTKFSYCDVYLNEGNFFSVPNFNLYQRKNYVLSLNDSYINLYSNFRNNVKRNIKKATQLNCTIQKGVAIDEVIELAKNQGTTLSKIPINAFDRFKQLYAFLQPIQQATTYAVLSPQGQIVASAVFFTDQKRAYYILVGNHPLGKAFGASHALINAFIQDNAGSDLLLDFEGSDFDSIAFFYSSFGAVEKKYPGLRFNKLPFYVRWFKK